VATETDTSLLGIPYPTSANNGSNFAQGLADMAAALDVIVPELANDLLLAGVVAAGAGLVANPAVSSAGVVSLTGIAAGNAYLALSSGVLVRNAIPTGSYSATPSLPASGKYATVGIDLVGGTWGATASVALSAKGTDQNTSALALANPPAVASGRYRLMNVVILNTSGTYSLSTSQDARSVAQTGTVPGLPVSGIDYDSGASGTASNSPQTIAGLSVTTPSLLAGQVLVVRFYPAIVANGNNIMAALVVDGTAVNPMISTNMGSITTALGTAAPGGLVLKRFAVVTSGAVLANNQLNAGVHTLTGEYCASAAAGGIQAQNAYIYYEVRNT
jgi:hypothetical protein